MVRIVISIVLLLSLCVLVVLNMDHTAPVNLFGVTLDKVSIVAVGLVSFVLGVLYSFFLYASRYVAGLRKNALGKRRRDVEQREKEAVGSEGQGPAPRAEDPAAKAAESPAETEPSRKRGRRPRP